MSNIFELCQIFNIQVFCVKTYSVDSYIKWKFMMCTLNNTKDVFSKIFVDFELFNNLWQIFLNFIEFFVL